MDFSIRDKNIISYCRLNSIMAIKYSLLINGPCILALPVYSDRADFWNGDDYQGGHAICCVGYNEDNLISAVVNKKNEATAAKKIVFFISLEYLR